MTDYKLIAFDMDGTLLNSNKKLSPNTIVALNQAIDAGKIIALSTGRCLPELKEYFPFFSKLPYVICTSGALVMNPANEQEIYSKPIPVETCQYIFDVVKDTDVMYHFMFSKSMVQKDKIPNMKDYNMDVFRPMYERVTTPVDNILEYYQKSPFPLSKLNIYFRTTEDRQAAYEQLKHLNLTIAYAETTSLECNAPNVTKGEGLKNLCEFLNIPIEETIAVGDADNDIDILKTAGLAIAMDNANENVKKVADVIVADNDHEGCVEAIQKYLLGNDK